MNWKLFIADLHEDIHQMQQPTHDNPGGALWRVIPIDGPENKPEVCPECGRPAKWIDMGTHRTLFPIRTVHSWLCQHCRFLRLEATEKEGR